jgi:multidrug transporter EmrE-like cation transporter
MSSQMMGITFLVIGFIYIIKPNILNIIIGKRTPVSVHYKIYRRSGGVILIILAIVLFAAKKTVLTT